MTDPVAYEQVEVYGLGQWWDISAYINDTMAPLEAPAGRQTTLEAIEDSRFSATLNNSDRRFTCGNATSPYYPFWDQGAPIRWRTTIGGGTVAHFTGRLEMPQAIMVTAETDDDGDDAEVYCQITAVDRLTQLDRAPAFLSTLAEYIKYHGGDELVVYLPLNEPAGPTVSDPRQDFGVTEAGYPGFLSGGIPASTHPMTRYGDADPIPGDELNGIVFDPLLDAAHSLVAWSQLTATLPSTLVVDSGKSVALVVWVNFEEALTDVSSNRVFLRLTGPGGCYMEIDVDGVANTWMPAVEDFSGLGVPTSTAVANVGSWRLIALRLTEPSGLVEFWAHGADPVTATIPGATSAQLTDVSIFGQIPAAALHLQVYYGVGAYTRTTHLAQVAAGFSALDRQSVDARIRTVANYAGVTDAELNLEPSAIVLQPAQLAGQRPGAAMRAAAATDTGPLFSGGDGEITFQSRTHRYNL